MVILIPRPDRSRTAAPTGLKTQPDKYASGIDEMRSTAARSYVGNPTYAGNCCAARAFTGTGDRG